MFVPRWSQDVTVTMYKIFSMVHTEEVRAELSHDRTHNRIYMTVIEVHHDT